MDMGLWQCVNSLCERMEQWTADFGQARSVPTYLIYATAHGNDEWCGAGLKTAAAVCTVGCESVVAWIACDSAFSVGFVEQSQKPEEVGNCKRVRIARQ